MDITFVFVLQESPQTPTNGFMTGERHTFTDIILLNPISCEAFPGVNGIYWVVLVFYKLCAAIFIRIISKLFVVICLGHLVLYVY